MPNSEIPGKLRENLGLSVKVDIEALRHRYHKSETAK
jgi:hypothetical protein